MSPSGLLLWRLDTAVIRGFSEGVGLTASIGGQGGEVGKNWMLGVLRGEMSWE